MYYTHSNKALNVDQKWPKNCDDRMHPYRVNAYVLSPVEFLFGMNLSFLRMIGVNHIPHCYENKDAMATTMISE